MRVLRNFWAWLTLCPCRKLDYLDHETRTLHVVHSRWRDNKPVLHPVETGEQHG